MVRRFVERTKELNECDLVVGNFGWRLSCTNDSSSRLPSRDSVIAFLAYFRQLLFLGSDGIRFDKVVTALREELTDAELLQHLEDLEAAHRSIFHPEVPKGTRSMRLLTEDWISRYLHSERPNDLSNLQPSDYGWQFMLFPIAFFLIPAVKLANALSALIEEAERRRGIDPSYSRLVDIALIDHTCVRFVFALT